ncbi:glycyl-radical enzyme activating protein [Chloroflexota bacterium]
MKQQVMKKQVMSQQVRKKLEAVRGIVTNIQDYCIHDGPGIRTLFFLKGCPLRCWWCSNPETWSMEPELGYMKAKCTNCGKCAAACLTGATTLDADGAPQIDRQLCTACGKCVEVCPADARVIYGKEMTAKEIFEQVRKDEIFYRGSGGGVTVGGGEPLQQPQLVSAVFQLCRDADIHTAIETAGHVAPRILKDVLAVTDYVLFDLKHMDPQVHQQYTGQSNKLILDNARLVAASGVPFLFRIPLIPGVNDTQSNIQATADFVKSLGKDAARVELLPYHRLASSKYEALGRPYQMGDLAALKVTETETVKAAFEELGVVCTISY